MSLARDGATKIMISVPLDFFNVFFYCFVKSSLLYYPAFVVKTDLMSSLCERKNRGLNAQVVYRLQEKLKTSRPEPK